jgi:thiol-disulfide isomerase/thioredoxin
VSVVALIAALAALALSGFSLLLALGLARRVRAVSEGAVSLPGVPGMEHLPATGLAVPSFQAVALSGDPVASARLRTGRHVVAFISSECDACHEAMPHFAELASRLGIEHSLAVLTHDGTDSAAAEKLIGGLRSSSTVVVEDAARKVSRPFGVTSFPTFLGVNDGDVEFSSHRVQDVAAWQSR